MDIRFFNFYSSLHEMTANQQYIMIRSRLLLPLDEELGLETRIEDGYLLTEGAIIKEVGPYRPEIGERIIRTYGEKLRIIGTDQDGHPAGWEIPCLNGVILPGFVKAHGHDIQSGYIGIAKDESLLDWLDHAVSPFFHFLDESKEDLREHLGVTPYLLASLKDRLDDIYYGITSSLNHICHFNRENLPDLVESNTRAGTRMVAALGCKDRAFEPIFLDTIEEVISRLDECVAAFGGVERFRIIPGPDQVFSNSEKMLKAVKAWARDHDTLIHIHSSEEPANTRRFYRKYLSSPVQYLHRAGLMDENMMLVHQVNNTPVDLAIIRETGAGVVHNPLANTILGSGMPPIVEMMEMKIPVAISTDGSGSGDSQNILAAGRLASQYQKALHQDARLLPAQKVLEMITVVPAKMLRLNCGSLREGKDADLILIDLSRPNLTPTRSDNVVENLIWASDGSEVRWVIVDGKILKDDYRFITLDEEKVRNDLQELSQLFFLHSKKNSPDKVANEGN